MEVVEALLDRGGAADLENTRGIRCSHGRIRLMLYDLSVQGAKWTSAGLMGGRR